MGLALFAMTTSRTPSDGIARHQERPREVVDIFNSIHRLLMNLSLKDKTSVLLVEDDPHLRFFAHTAAERAGCFGEIWLAADGEDALTLIRQSLPGERPDMIISDLCMPRRTGVELIYALKQDSATRDIPVAIITSSNITNDRVDALRAGAAAFQNKPFGLDAYVAMFRSLHRQCVGHALAS